MKTMIGLSGGINSMAVLCTIAKSENKPKDIYLFYAHFEEHSPDTLEFVLAGVEYAKLHFENVIFEQTTNSVLDFFKQKKIIPHPTLAPCTRILKIMPAINFATKHGCTIDLIGYVKNEKKRVDNMQKNGADNLFLSKQFPILHLSNEDCFDIVKKEIGWYPKIYDIIENGKRVFSHNNCLPCKNMQLSQYKKVKEYFPDYWQKAELLSIELKKHWGRSSDDYYATFGKCDFEVGYKEQICETCSID